MKLNELAEQCHAISKSKGWYEGRQRQPLEFHMLMVSELAEASEEVRSGKPYVYQVQCVAELSDETVEILPASDFWSDNIKPEGEGIEVADCLIRILDYVAFKEWNIEELVAMKMKYNETRSHRHGGKVL